MTLEREQHGPQFFVHGESRVEADDKLLAGAVCPSTLPLRPSPRFGGKDAGVYQWVQGRVLVRHHRDGAQMRAGHRTVQGKGGEDALHGMKAGKRLGEVVGAVFLLHLRARSNPFADLGMEVQVAVEEPLEFGLPRRIGQRRSFFVHDTGSTQPAIGPIDRNE